MKDRLLIIFKNPFFSGSLVMLAGTNVYNAGQFLYHFIAIRLLDKAHYGDLAAIISLLGLMGIVQLSIGLTIVKFISAEKEDRKVPSFIRWFHWWSLWAGVAVAIITLLITPHLVDFLNITQPASVYLVGPFLFLFVILNTSRSVLQGLLSFGKYVASLMVEIGSKLVLTFLLIFIGWAVFGAMVALTISISLALFFILFSLKDKIFGKLGPKPEVFPLIKYSVPVLVQGISLTTMYSVDLITVKHFFNPEMAGLYAGLSVLGRVVFFGAAPIANVMFPLIAKRHSHGHSYHSIFILSLVLISCICIFVVGLYYLFPQIVIATLNKAYLEGSPILWWFALFMSLLSLASLFTQFYLSINKTRIIYIFPIAAIVQAVILWMFHSSLLQVIQLSSLVATLLVIGLLVYFPYHHRSSPKGFGGTSNK